MRTAGPAAVMIGLLIRFEGYPKGAKGGLEPAWVTPPPLYPFPPRKAGCLHGCLSISGSGLPETFDRFVDNLFQLLVVFLLQS